MSTSANQKSVTEGDVAPDFELLSDENETWRLSDYRDRPVVLLFFPGAFTSVCTAELKTVNTDLDSFGDAHVVGISTNSAPVLAKYRSEHGFEFSLLSDHSANVSAQYGTKYDENFGPMNLDRISKRAAFVVDGKGIVCYAEVLEDAGNEPDYEAIDDTLNALAESRPKT